MLTETLSADELYKEGLLGWGIRKNGSLEVFSSWLDSKGYKPPFDIESALDIADEYATEKQMMLIDQLKKETGEWPELLNADGDRLAAILPEPKIGSSPIRLSYYKRNGPISHECYSSMDQAWKAAIRAGYNIPAGGTLDEWSDLEEWHRGVVVCQLLNVGDGRITQENIKALPKQEQLMFDIDCYPLN